MEELGRQGANFVAMTPLDFLRRAGAVYPAKTAIVHGTLRRTYAEMLARAQAMASALRQAGLQRGDRVSALLLNTPALLEAHFGVPGAGLVLNAINTRLDAAGIAVILDHAESRVLLLDRGLSELGRQALAQAQARPRVIWVDDPAAQAVPPEGDAELEAFLATGDPTEPFLPPEDEWDSIALNYTSGTTGSPKGVVYGHRGAYLAALGNALAFRLGPESRYLWTLPMFHCNGWSFPWAVTAVGGTHVCLRQVDPAQVFRLVDEERVTHLCAAPVVLTMLVHAAPEAKRRFAHGTVAVATGGAAPASTTIRHMEEMGFAITHLYGMTESHGPSTICAVQENWPALPAEERAALMARQGVNTVTLADQAVLHPASLLPVPADGATLGELVLRGNTVMKGYFRNPEATRQALGDGWLRTGDLAVKHPDGYVEIKDRAKDVIISGGENISSLEVEETLFRHPAVMEAAVVARPDPKWGETPCAFVTLKPGVEAPGVADIIAFCRARMAGFKVPRTVVFGPLPKTATGKIQKHVLRDAARAL